MKDEGDLVTLHWLQLPNFYRYFCTFPGSKEVIDLGQLKKVELRRGFFVEDDEDDEDDDGVRTAVL